MPRLVVEKGHDKGKVFIIQPKTTIVVGRDASATANLRDTMCSRQHFRIEAREDGYYLIDMGSLNGTLLNGKPIKEEKLSFGDLIKTGETLLSFLSDETTVDQSMVGQRLGGYKIIERLGRGGMGTVYKAEQIDLQRVVALKVIAPEHAKDTDFTEMFVHEARAAARLNHPNIVQVYDVKKQNEVYFFSMEYVPGGSIQEMLNKQRKFPFKQALRMTLDAGRGLEYAHKKDVIHRDVKPDNLMVDENGGIKIGDLGLAQGMGEKLSADDDNSIIGTPHYIAPEQVLGKPADYRSDIYSLGSTMYRMIAGFTPYQAPGVRELMNKKVREDAPPLDKAAEGVPQQVAAICAKMMARKPEERYQTMTEVIVDIERHLRQPDGEEADSAGSESVGNKNLLLAAIGLLIVVMVGGVIGAVAFMRKPPQVDNPQNRDKTGDELAMAKLENAKTYELNHMDKNKAEDIQRAIKEYQAIIDGFAETRSAAEAQEHIDGLKQKLGEINAAFALEEIEKQDRENWPKMYQAFQGGRFDLGPVEATALSYKQFAEADESKNTAAVKEANQRAEFIYGWIARVNELQAAFEKVRQEATAKSADERFQEAWVVYDQFAQQAQKKKIVCTFATDRYGSILFDESARGEQKKIMEAARTSYDRIDARAKELEDAKQYEEAIKLLAPAIEKYPEEFRQRATTRQNALLDEWVKFRTAEAIEKAKEAERARAADAEEFEKYSKEVREDFLKWDFKTAQERFGGNGGDDCFHPRTDKYRERARMRAAEMGYLADFKETLKKIVNDKKGNPNFKRESKLIEQPPGTIRAMNDGEFSIQMDAGGTIAVAFKMIKPSVFYRYLDSCMVWTEPKALQALVIYCCEAGLYEDALKKLSVLEKSDSKDEGFCKTYRSMLESGEYSDSDESEAEKRWNRGEELYKAGSLEAVKHFSLLQTRYKETKCATEHKREIQKHLEDIRIKGGKELKDKERQERLKRVHDLRKSSRSDANDGKANISSRLSHIGDVPADRALGDSRTAEFHAAWGEWDASNRRLQKAKAELDRNLDDRLLGRQSAISVAPIYAQLHRNYVATRNRQKALQLHDEARNKLRPRLEWRWNDLDKQMNQMEERQPLDQLKIEKLETGLKDGLDDAEALQILAYAYLANCSYLEARGCLQALIEVYPEAPKVATGDAQYQLAEVLLAFGDVKGALKTYEDLEDKHRDYDKVTNARSSDSVMNRKLFCGRLIGIMGLDEKK